jgi:phospholipid/cholesterol/gamma-HCH transport system permease protein
MNGLLDSIGQRALRICNRVGDFFMFLVVTIQTLFTTRLKVHRVLAQMQQIGVESLVIVVLTGLSTGLALALQTYIGFERFGIQDFLGTIVTLGMTRELGPVLTGIMVTGRCGSAITAELGTMQITDQIDALKTLCVNPYQYLIVPRILGSMIILPFLTVFSMIFGIIGGFFFCVYVKGLNADSYMSGIRQFVELSDITGGLIKASFFGLILAWVGSYYGYRTRGGARGVGRATTRAVVVGSIMILIANYFLSFFLYESGIS